MSFNIKSLRFKKFEEKNIEINAAGKFYESALLRTLVRA